MLYKIYIGSNNKTKKLEKAEAIKIISTFFLGFSTSEGLGYWKGTPEKSLFIEVSTDREDLIMRACSQLKKRLNQEAIGLARFSSLEFI